MMILSAALIALLFASFMIGTFPIMPSLDYGNQVKILHTIRHLAQAGYGILMTSHYPDHAFLAGTRAVLMRDGRVMAEGVPGEVVTTESLTALYDAPVEVAEAMAAHEKVKVCIPLLQ